MSPVLGAGLIAALELDAASIGPFLLSRPFVIGPLFGWLLGEPLLGAWLGVAVEAVTLEELPLGGCLKISAPVAAGIAVWLAAGPSRVPVEAAFIAGLSAGYSHASIERKLRSLRSHSVHAAENAAAQGRSPQLGLRLASTLAVQAAATFAVCLAVLLAGASLSRLWPSAPEMLRAGLKSALLAAPWLGAGSLAVSLWRRA